MNPTRISNIDELINSNNPQSVKLGCYMFIQYDVYDAWVDWILDEAELSYDLVDINDSIYIYEYVNYFSPNGEPTLEYELTQPLTQEQLQELAEYTQGQWSDGIGKGFEQFPCKEINGEEIYISPWSGGQKLYVEQNEIE